MKIVGAVLVFFAFASITTADTVTLKNGDHLTGVVEHSDGKTLTLKTDYAGEVNVQWSAIKELVCDEPLYVMTPDKKTVNGQVTTEGGDLVVTTANAGAVRVPLASVTVIRSEIEQAAYERGLHPGILENWQGGANVGLALARGNSDTTNLSIGFNAARTTLHDKLIAYAATIYASNSTAGISGVTANDIRGGARYDRNFSSRLFAFGSGDYEYNELQELDLRSIYTGGLGYNAIKSDSTKLDLLLGANYTRETYSTGVQRNLAGITTGEDFFHKFGKSTTLTEQFLFYPDLTNTGQYRFAFDMGITTKISKWLGWQTTASDRYLSDPIPGTKTDDLILTTGLTFTFIH